MGQKVSLFFLFLGWTDEGTDGLIRTNDMTDRQRVSLTERRKKGKTEGE